MKFLNYNLKVKRQNNNHIVIEGLANANTVDRAKERISPDAWDLSNFKKNPIVLFNHGHDSQFGYMPVGFALDVKATDEGLYTKIKLSNSTNDKIRAVRDLVEEGILKTFSVGFEPSETEKKGDHDLITKAQLIEVSIVPIPMNQDSTFSILSKSYNFIRSSVAKSWIADKLLSKDLAEKGHWFASAVHQRFYDLQQQDGAFDRDAVIKYIAETAEASINDINKILTGETIDVPQKIIDAFSAALRIDKQFLETLSKGDVVVIKTKPEEEKGMKTKMLIQSLKVSKEKYPNEEDAIKLAEEGGYSVEKPAHDDEYYVFMQDEVEGNLKEMEIAEGVIAIVESEDEDETPEVEEEKTYIQKEIDDNPHLQQARQTNILLASLIKEIQEMSKKLDGMPERKIEEIVADESENQTEELKAKLKSYQDLLSQRLTNIGA